ncbi:NAD-dependent epimerase/dehydratase family protein [Geothrix sp. PMB-07]|uniref:NAD-dependent epimerase/dehydratase family protein n=1 Tax=Geothrix sp. PMB-07 TaxID=3068640 RepID=UPI00274106C3|nr:NAD-dependent epimerase/dehydratase family protein [Geothrix sp. PMB-07]WLT30777.1 NAD-dependent epimerase/dehydratase family protein [Geothrix sp. PMB-07]
MQTRAANQGTLLIVGCGYVGTRLARRLMGEGPLLALVRRHAAAETLLGQGIPAVAMDVAREAAAVSLSLPSDLRAVVYLVPPGGPGAEDLRLVAFLEATAEAAPRAFVYISTTGVYGDTGGAAVDEASPTVPREDRSRQRLDAEQQVACWCEARGARAVVLRVPAIYGPHRLPLERLQRGEPVLREADSGPGNRIHVDDLVEACVAALERPAAGAFNLTDGAPESMAAFSRRVAALAGLPPPRQVSWAEAQTQLSPGLLAFLRESRLVTSRRREELGWSPTYANPEDGIRASLTEMGWMSEP